MLGSMQMKQMKENISKLTQLLTYILVRCNLKTNFKVSQIKSMVPKLYLSKNSVINVRFCFSILRLMMPSLIKLQRLIFSLVTMLFRSNLFLFSLQNFFWALLSFYWNQRALKVCSQELAGSLVYLFFYLQAQMKFL